MTVREALLDCRPIRLEEVPRPATAVALVWTLLVVAAITDVLTTLYGFHVGLNEWNPIARGILLEYGLLGKVALKGAAIGYTAVAFVVIDRMSSRSSAVWTVGAVAALWFGAAGWNLVVIFGLVA